MKSRFNYVVLATVAFVFIVTTANAKNVPQNPVAKNQSSPVKPSARMWYNTITFLVSHIEAPEKSTTVTKAKNILVTSTVSTTMVESTSVATTPVKVFVPVNNNKATSPVKGTANTATATMSIEGTTATQAVKISNVEKVIENQNNENQISIKRYVNTNQQTAIIKPGSRTCCQ
ncbi:uncharacterized protein LOC107882555 [Acyrthosiphon pisum]|uniref:Uncharacterized protein n=1 Tax=Acyrthosiphon pisum TaxID=7029 RepID=A0A8R2D2E6_ACYPI|nr:uncharacterized protein LOC107882555 [Acyrthosiphon pisum]|eukprot:XP_016656560.1 PREDICTED: uncharacterized protein LOC107882555 [Acyrthosiphon pisum]